MAFLGRMNSQGSLIDCEVLSGRRPKSQSSHSSSSGEDGTSEDARMLSPHSKGSRTYIKAYDASNLLRAMGSPSTVRYVGSSVSSSDLVSLDETETSTLRCGSLPSTDTLKIDGDAQASAELDSEPDTLCLQLGSDSSYSGSNSSSRSSDRSSGSRSSASRSSGSRSSSSQELQYPNVDKDSTTSMCSWEEAMSRGESMQRSQQDGRNPSLTMSSLNLGSGHASAHLTFTRHLDPLRLQRPAGEAYENWLSAKRRQRHYKLEADRVEQEEQQQRLAFRQRMSKERYDQWYRQKTQKAPTANANANAPATSTTSSMPDPQGRNARRQARSLDLAKHSIREWEMQKIRQEEQRRLKTQNAQRRIIKEKMQRQQNAEEAFQRWLKNVAQRPKPVPSCQGIQSLRGTISDIYINPNQWVN
ncbi:hypothetical protein KR018_004374 [Drosophila ironensis]|nr:hypothetical protein KR018_004374 [Drosophila ironensis]